MPDIINNLDKYKLSRTLLKLEKEGQLLVTNTFDIRPLLITEGKDLIISAMKAVENNDSYPPGDNQLYQTLYDYKIIVKSTDEEKSAYFDYKYNPDAKKNGSSLYLLVSQDCNLRCKYCFADEYPYRQKEEMSFDVAKQAINKSIKRLKANGSLSLIFFGGEPLMNWSLIKEVIAYVEAEIKPKNKKKKITYHITTNLTELPEDFVGIIKKHKVSLLTDIDGHNAEVHDFLRPMADKKTSSFDKIIANIAMLKEEGIKVETRASICRSNQQNIFEISNHLQELSGVGTVLELLTPFDCSKNPLPKDLLADIAQYIKDVTQIYKNGNPPVENIFPINKMLEKIRGGKGSPVGCGMPWGNIHIVDHVGDVYMCTFLVGQKEYKLGNVFDPGLSFSNEQKAVDGVFRRVHVDYVDECKKCPLKYLCTGHCPVARLAIEANEKEGKKAPEYVKQYSKKKSCKMSKVFYEMLLWDLANNSLPVPSDNKLTSCC